MPEPIFCGSGFSLTALAHWFPIHFFGASTASRGSLRVTRALAYARRPLIDGGNAQWRAFLD